MGETVNDIIGKGFKYEERTEITTLIDNLSGTKVAFVGAANWGPVSAPTEVIKSFYNYFGTEVNRDTNTRDYSGMTASKVLDVTSSCFFTRITDGTDTAASKLIMKTAKAAKLTGAEVVQGKTLKVNDSDNIFGVEFDGSTTTVTLTKSSRCAAIESSSLVATNFAVGDYIEFFVDGVAYQKIVSVATDILCKMTGLGAYDDSYYGGLATENVIPYIDRLIYAIKAFIGHGDLNRIVRKEGTDKITLNSVEYGASSSIKVTSFPVVFPSATITSPLQSLSSNSTAEDIIDEINTAVIAAGSGYINADSKFELQSLTTGLSSSVQVFDEPTLNRDTNFTNNLLAGAGLFSADPAASWSVLTNSLKSWLEFVTGQTVTYGNAILASAGHQDIEFAVAVAGATSTGIDDSTAAYAELTGCSFANGAALSGLAAGTPYWFKLNIDGAGAEEYTFTTNIGAATVTQFLTDVASAVKVVGGAPLADVVFSLTPATAGTIRVSRDVTGATPSIALSAGTSGADLWAVFTGYTGIGAPVAGDDGTTYTMEVSINGAAAVTVDVVAVDVPTIADLVTEIQTDLGTDAVVTFVDADDLIKIESNLLDTQSTIEITDVDLIAALDSAIGADIGTAAAGRHGSMDILFDAGAPGTGILDEDEICPIPGGDFELRLTIDAHSAADVTVSNSVKLTWKQFIETVIGNVPGVTAAWNSTNGGITITSVNAGIDNFTHAPTVDGADIIIADTASPTTGGVTMTFHTDHVNLATSATSTIANAVAQKFTIAAGNAFENHEIYFKIPTDVTNGINFKVDIYKGFTLVGSKTVDATDITNGYARTTFYALEAGSDYYCLIRDALPGTTIRALQVDNLYVGLTRPTVNGNLLDFLGIKDSDSAYDYTDILYYGENANMDMGTLEAVYTGSDGNNLFMIKGTSNGIEYMEFYNDQSLIARFSNFSYTFADDTFFGTLINNDTRMQEYITYSNPGTVPTTLENIPDGTYYLNGGTSGIDNITDAQYAAALQEYQNMDIFDVDMLVVTGNSTATVISKIQTICEYRRDCFGVVDPPEVVAGQPGGVPTGGIDQMIYWHNGDLPAILNLQLDSKYLVTYFPWILVDTDSITNSEQWMPPSLVAVPKIVEVDKNFNKFTPPAGKYATLADVNDIAYYLTEEDKGRAYDDNIGNNINPIVYTNRQGFFMDGQKTSQRERNAYNRMATMKVSLFMKRKLMEIVPNFFYLPITSDTRKEFESVIERDIITPLVSASAIKPEQYTDWEIITDPARISNENPEIIEASLGMVAIISWTPVKQIEKIKVISIMRDTQVIVQF